MYVGSFEHRKYNWYKWNEQNMWYAISKFMKWDMLSRICDVI